MLKASFILFGAYEKEEKNMDVLVQIGLLAMGFVLMVKGAD